MSKILANATKAAAVVMPSLPVWPLLTATLVVLKLLGLISISWLWVFSPLWLPPAVVLGALGGFILVLLIGVLIGSLAAWVLNIK